MWRFLSLGYLSVVAVGTVLLVLPFSAAAGQSTSFIDALLTATSATCVTGLIAVDTAVHWSAFGEIVILILIQLGGLGFMTFVGVIVKSFNLHLSLSSRNALMTSAGAREMTGVTTLVRRIFIGTVICEAVGACLLTITFVPQFGARGVYFAIFHAVSAFCNAGFDVLGANGAQFASLTAYTRDVTVSLVIPALIIIGGLGFCVWDDVIDRRFRFGKFSLYTKVVLVMNIILIVGGTLLFLGFEYDNPFYDGYNFGEKLLASFFNAVTPRTAGFSTTPADALSEGGKLLTILFMFIGGSSGSTAGGIKVSTFAVIVMGMWAVLRGKRDINIGNRRIDNNLLSRALAIFTACLMLVTLGTLIICAAEPTEVTTFEQALFECFSALGTVGLTLGITPNLGVLSKLVLIVLMYAGRVGILTLALALGESKKTDSVRKPVDTLLIG